MKNTTYLFGNERVNAPPQFITTNNFIFKSPYYEPIKIHFIELPTESRFRTDLFNIENHEKIAKRVHVSLRGLRRLT